MTKARLKLLILNGYGYLNGDVQTNLVALRGFSPDLFDISVICKPRGEVYEELIKISGIQIYPLEMGNRELSLPGRESKYHRLVDFVIAVFKIKSFVQKYRIDLIYTIDRGVDPFLSFFVSKLTDCHRILNAAYPYYPHNGVFARYILQNTDNIQMHSHFLLEKLKPYIVFVNRKTDHFNHEKPSTWAV